MTVYIFIAKLLIRRYEFSLRSDSACNHEQSNQLFYFDEFIYHMSNRFEMPLNIVLKIFFVVQLLFSNKLLICSSVVINQN